MRVDGPYVYAESAGLALQSLGPLEANGIDPTAGIRHFVFRFPLQPKPANGPPIATPFGITGAFANGVPLYNFTSAVSYRDQNLWHLDAAAATPQTPLLSALLQTGGKHSPLVGFAFDGYPIYGPWGGESPNAVKRFRSSYRLRAIASRIALPDGTQLNPSQEGPPVSAQFPLGSFVEDYEFAAGSGDLDEHNGRWARTPEYPNGTYAYFLSTDRDNRIMYPYLIGPTYFGNFEALNVSNAPQSLQADHKPLDRSDLAYIRLTTPARLESGKPQTLSFTIRNARGRRLRFLEIAHERPIHLVVASKDLKEFAHIHPELRPDDTFAVTHSFAHGGEYWLFADFTRPGAPPSIARFTINVEGARRSLEALSADKGFTKTEAGLQVTLTLPENLQAGEDLIFRFDAMDAKTGRTVSDLQPYLGAWAHILIVPEDKSRMIHVHPIDDASLANDADPWRHTHPAPGPSPSRVTAITGLREPGLYRMWVQFQREGDVITVPYTIAVRPGSATPHVEQGVRDAIHVKVSRAGFEPSRIFAPAGKPVRIAFERNDAENCAAAIVFPELNIRKQLPAGRTTLVELPELRARELSFSCGMNMYRGSLVIR